MKSSAPAIAQSFLAGPLVARPLLAWYDRNRRVLPWRAQAGQQAEPYRVWLSEIMLQQTTVAAVKPYYERFLARWPSLMALANAALEDILKEWAGLGYYSRARNLHACARMLRDQFGGEFPHDEHSLRQLPGVGRYTAAAIAAIAFDEPAAVMDGNVERVLARLFAVRTAPPQAKAELYRLAQKVTPKKRSGDFAQAMMDLGATICIPRAPRCDACPLKQSCQAYAQDIAADLPVRAPKTPKPKRLGYAFIIINDQGEVLLERRAAKGMLGGMAAFPTSAWESTRPSLDQSLGALGWGQDKAQLLPLSVRHVFTHFELSLDIVAINTGRKTDGIWLKPEMVEEQGLPSLMQKVWRAYCAAHEAQPPPGRAGRARARP